ncbi:hypothetical protein AADZ90_004835 [Aestuariibius sp. 2305UL40-4]|uniref:hypothetical protein n=1 Tax=Aestuariibius violaceus TaxID=3234132 RepID=UPI00345EAAD5
MRVIHESQDCLIVESRPLLLSVLFIPVILAFVYVAMQKAAAGASGDAAIAFFVGGGMGLLGLISFAEVKRFTFDRSARTVEHLCRSIFSTTRQTHSLDHVLKAVIQRDNSGDGDAYRPALLISTTEGEDLTLPLTHISGSFIQTGLVDQINGWLGRDLPTEYVLKNPPSRPASFSNRPKDGS